MVWCPGGACGVTDWVASTTTASMQERVEPEWELVERLREAQAAAVGEAYDAHHMAVRAFALRLLGDGAAADDLVHEVFVALPQAVKNFRGESSLRTFLIAMAVRRAKHHVRHAMRQRAAFLRLGREPLPEHAGPEEVVKKKQLAAALTRALDKLSLEHRVAFVLCEVEERSSREVATIIDAPEGTVRTRLFHAKKKLRLELEREGFR
jgi:RNA polymerase sigma-70 factor, ECF subfamily